MKTTVVYYSYTGRTDLAARTIAGVAGTGDLRRIEEVRPRKGIFGFLRGGLEAVGGKKTEIKPADPGFAGSDRVVIAAPVWAGKLPPALNAFLDKADFAGAKVFGVCTFGGSPTEKFAQILEERVRAKNGEWAGFSDIRTGGGAKNEEIIRKAEEIARKALGAGEV